MKGGEIPDTNSLGNSLGWYSQELKKMEKGRLGDGPSPYGVDTAALGGAAYVDDLTFRRENHGSGSREGPLS